MEQISNKKGKKPLATCTVKFGGERLSKTMSTLPHSTADVQQSALPLPPLPHAQPTAPKSAKLRPKPAPAPAPVAVAATQTPAAPPASAISPASPAGPSSGRSSTAPPTPEPSSEDGGNACDGVEFWEVADGQSRRLAGNPLGAYSGDPDGCEVGAAGYQRTDGPGELGAVTLYEKVETTELTKRYRFVAEVSFNHSSVHFFFVADANELLRLMPSLAATTMLEKLTTTLDQLMVMAARAFRAWHGHDADESCEDCDPRAHAERERWRAQRQQARKEGRS